MKAQNSYMYNRKQCEMRVYLYLEYNIYTLIKVN